MSFRGGGVSGVWSNTIFYIFLPFPKEGCKNVDFTIRSDPPPERPPPHLFLGHRPKYVCVCVLGLMSLPLGKGPKKM